MREGSIPPKSSKGAVDDRARCEAPIEEFVAFARRLLEARSKNRLKALGAGSVAEIFTKRLIAEGLGGSSQAVTCLKLIGALGQETAWAARLQQRDATGPLPVANAMKPQDMEPVGRGLLVISPPLALPWIAGAYLVVGRSTAAFRKVEALLLEAASTTASLAEALGAAVGTLQARSLPLTVGVLGRCIDALQKLAGPPADSEDKAQELPLVKLAREAGRIESARLLAALLPAVLARQTDMSPPVAEEPPIDPITELAWNDADEALGRALQDAEFMTRSFDRLEAAARGGLTDSVRRARNAANLVLQWVCQAARYRKVATLHKTGDSVAFDPAVHDLDGYAAIGERVKIIKPAIVRDSGAQQVVVLRAEAESE